MSSDRKPIKDGRSPEARNMDDLVMKLREVEAVRSVDSDSETIVLRFDVSRWEDGADIPEATATLLFEEGFVPTSFGREHNPAQDEHLPMIRFEAVESVTAREGKSQ